MWLHEDCDDTLIRTKSHIVIWFALSFIVFGKWGLIIDEINITKIKYQEIPILIHGMVKEAEYLVTFMIHHVKYYILCGA